MSAYSEPLVHLATLIAMKNNYASSFIVHLIIFSKEGISNHSAKFRNAAA